MKKKGKGKVMGWNEVKFRKQWKMNPVERIHREGKKDGYNRNEWKKQDRNIKSADDFDSEDNN